MALQELLDRLNIPNLPQNLGSLCLESTLMSAKSIVFANVDKDLIEHEIFWDDDSLTKIYGFSPPHKLSEFCKKYKDVAIIKQSEAVFLDDIISTLKKSFDDGHLEPFFEYSLYDNKGQKKFIVQRFILFKNEKDELCTISIFNDLTYIRQKQEDEYNDYLKKLAYTDSVTGGYNYTHFKEKVKENALPGFIICVDIHNFKVINSTCGINKGDDYLRKVWENIFSLIDSGDIAAHINADHFIIYISSQEKKVVERIVKNITLSMFLISNELNVPQLQPYFGISSWEPSKKIELSYSQAVAAKHNIKDNPSENYAFFTEDDTNRLILEKQMEDAFESSLAKKEFIIYYQPKYSPSTRKLVGAEALIRWQNSDGSLVPPSVFIPLFERNGMIRQLDEYVFRNVCQQQKKWKERGYNIVPVSINISRVSLYYKNVVAKYKRILTEYGLDPEYIPIEITESAAINDSEIQSIADTFYKAGFHLHLDDFGSGYSSLASLNILHFDTLKIDKSLIDYIGNYNGDKLLEHTIALAKDLGIHVTAEGVEDEIQNKYLWHIGCDSIQGYYFSKPMPKNDYENLLKQNEITQADLYKEQITKAVNKIKRTLSKKSCYDCIINLTDDIIIDYIGYSDWSEYITKSKSSYEEVVNHVLENYVMPEFKDIYKEFLDRKILIDHFKGVTKTKTLYYRRKYNSEVTWVKTSITLFKLEEADIICMYASMTQVE